MKTATVGQHATLAIHSARKPQLSKSTVPRDEHNLSSRSLLKVKEAIEQPDTAYQTAAQSESSLTTPQQEETESQSLRPDEDSEQSKAPIERKVHKGHLEDSKTPPILLGRDSAGQRDSPLRRELTDRRHDIWQCSSQAGSPFRAVAGSLSSGLAQGQASSSHSGDSDQCDSPRWDTFSIHIDLKAQGVVYAALK